MKFLILVLAALVAVASAVDTTQETTCQSHRRNAGGKAALMTWDIKCDDQGFYEPLQCTTQTPKWCTCYNKEEAVTGPSRRLKHCDCPIARHAAGKNAASECETPTCASNGKYEKKQCCSRTRKCHCVDEATGRKLTEPAAEQSVNCP